MALAAARLVAGLAAVLAVGCAALPEAAPPAIRPASPAAPEQASGWTAKTVRYARRDMIAAAHPLAAEAGVRILAQGGSATDAAIAAQMVLNLVEPQSSGIGGGGLMLHHDPADNVLAAYDGRETAPAAATPDLFLRADGTPLPFVDPDGRGPSAVDGGRPVGTPGLLRMLELAHARHGRLPWAALFQPAIELAEAGFAVSPRLHVQIVGAAARLRAQGEPAAGYFLKPDGSAKEAGTLLRNPALAATFRAIAAGGADAFYGGDIARAIVDKVRGHPTNPGRLALADLQGYRPKARAAVCGKYRGFTVCGMPPPSSGGIAVLQALGILSSFDVGLHAPGSVDAVHLLSEAYRLAYADRARYVADADFVPVPTAGLLDAGYLRGRAALIDMDRTIGAAKAGVPPGAAALGARGADRSAALPATTHLSVVDRDGRAVALTSSIETGFGSLQMVRGFLLNNQLTDFSFVPADAQGRPVANRIEPGKRPLSAMAPTIVFDAQSRVEAVLGSPGGPGIIQYVAKTLVGLIDWGLDIQQAIDLPNFGAQAGATTVLEAGTPAVGAAPGLRARGHAVAVNDLNSGVHGIVFNGVRPGGQPGRLARDPARGNWAGGADPRREGVVRGND